MFRSRPAGLASLVNDGINRAAPGLHESRALLTLDSIGDAVLSTDLAGKVTYLNAVAERMTGWSAIEAAGRPLQDVMRMIDADSREPVRDPLALAVRCQANVGVGVNCLLVARDGHETPIEDTAAPIRDRDGRVIGAVIVFHDIGAARALSLRMSHLAQHDVLTGLPNRLLLTDRLDRAVASARRLGSLAGRAVHRPGSLQEHQRQPRSCDRRPGPAVRCEPAGGRRAPIGHREPPRR